MVPLNGFVQLALDFSSSNNFVLMTIVHWIHYHRFQSQICVFLLIL